MITYNYQRHAFKGELYFNKRGTMHKKEKEGTMQNKMQHYYFVKGELSLLTT